MIFKTSFLYVSLIIGAFTSELQSMESHELQSPLPFSFDNKQLDLTAYPELAKFYKKYSPPAELQEKIKEHMSLIENAPAGPLEQMPEIYIKGSDIRRIINALRLKRCIEKHDLTLLDVAKKYILYSNGIWKVVAEKIPPHPTISSPIWNKKLSLKQVQQLATLTEATGFEDWQFDCNWILHPTNHDLLVCVDTEDRSFYENFVRSYSFHPFCNKFACINILLTRSSIYMTQEAAQWLRQHAKYLKENKEGEEGVIPLCKTTSYDDADIDFEQVKKEFQNYKRYKNS
jgi:hypothetical protein